MFDPDAGFPVPDDPQGRKFLVFIGMLSYFPNSDGICRFAETVFPELRRNDPELELFIVGRDPPRGVVRLASQEGITVVGPVDDVRPFLAAARAVVVPLRVARGIQNKVLEALAMGKTVLASKEICDTFRPDLPTGIVSCGSVADYADAISALPPTPHPDTAIVESTRLRFDWPERLSPLVTALRDIEQEVPGAMREERVLSA
jgi:polysaccharide biosynthesis protein PslH